MAWLCPCRLQGATPTVPAPALAISVVATLAGMGPGRRRSGLTQLQNPVAGPGHVHQPLRS